MAARKNCRSIHARLSVCLILIWLGTAVSAAAQSTKRPPSENTARVETENSSRAETENLAKADNVSSDYLIGPDDILSIKVMDSWELSGKYRVTEEGYVQVPWLSNQIKAAGLTTLQVSRALGDALKAADLFLGPVVTVLVEEYHGRTVTVLGAVARPSVYPLPKPTTVLELLSMAGGLLPNAGTKLTIAHKTPQIEGLSETDREMLALQSTVTISLNKLLNGQDLSLNVQVLPGDAVTVSTAPVIFVVGAVARPGGYAVQDRNEMTTLQALALAGGLTPDAGRSRSLIIRRSTSGQDRRLIPVNLKRLMTGKLPDQYLEANDILFVPESSSRKSLHHMEDLAVNTANTAAVYGIGFRLVPH